MYAFAAAAVVMTLLFVVAAIRRPRPAAFLAAVLWGAYAVYEYFVANGTLCDAGCNIRVDLVLFLPLLGWATYLGLRTASSDAAAVVLAIACLVLAAFLAFALGYTAAAGVAGVLALAVGAYGLRSRASAGRS